MSVAGPWKALAQLKAAAACWAVLLHKTGGDSQHHAARNYPWQMLANHQNWAHESSHLCIDLDIVVAEIAAPGNPLARASPNIQLQSQCVLCQLMPDILTKPLLMPLPSSMQTFGRLASKCAGGKYWLVEHSLSCARNADRQLDMVSVIHAVLRSWHRIRLIDLDRARSTHRSTPERPSPHQSRPYPHMRELAMSCLSEATLL